MNPEVLEKVLNCRTLPSLPAVARRVVELTQRDQVSFKDLAETIQNDQALAAKILRTVNSSLFGLRKKCSSINQAIIMLGLSAVKSLALGFSLVAAIKESAGEGFDMPAHWRRALYTGVAAKQIAAKAGIPGQEECFLGGLLQDVGMVALHQALGSSYLAVIAPAAGDHRKVAQLELDRMQVQHPDLGALLARRWKLPEELVMPIKYHERPTAAPSEYADICRAVGLGNIAAELMTSEEPAPLLRRYYEKAEQWFGLDAAKADEILKAITVATKEVARFLAVPTGGVADAEEVLERAREQLAALAIPDNTSLPLLNMNEFDRGITDELTGVGNRTWFDQTLIAAFEQAKSGAVPLTVALFDIDGMKQINDTSGQDAGDNVLVVVASRLERAFSSTHALLARLEGGRFGVVLPRMGRLDAVRLCEGARQLVGVRPLKLVAARSGTPGELKVSMSVGMACIEPATVDRFDDVNALLEIVASALRAAKKSGRNAMRVYAPSVPAAA